MDEPGAPQAQDVLPAGSAALKARCSLGLLHADGHAQPLTSTESQHSEGWQHQGLTSMATYPREPARSWI